MFISYGNNHNDACVYVCVRVCESACVCVCVCKRVVLKVLRRITRLVSGSGSFFFFLRERGGKRGVAI